MHPPPKDERQPRRGSHPTLTDVVKHYSDLNEDRLHADGERILKPLKLAQTEVADMVAFLESLSEKRKAAMPRIAHHVTCRP